MSILNEIRKQPQHIREVMFGFSVIITISLIGVVWFNSFQHNLYTLLNPEQTVQEKMFADNKSVPSPLGYLAVSLKNITGSLLGFIGGQKSSIEVPADTGLAPKRPDKPYMLPLPDYK